MRALTAAERAICYATAVQTDVSLRANDKTVRIAAAARAALLTPIAKAFSTDIANEVTSLNIQVHGGAGFMSDLAPHTPFRSGERLSRLGAARLDPLARLAALG
jgi:alkylation response protein AidB-like acyl-CoA dehydrogenase